MRKSCLHDFNAESFPDKSAEDESFSAINETMMPILYGYSSKWKPKSENQKNITFYFEAMRN